MVDTDYRYENFRFTFQSVRRQHVCSRNIMTSHDITNFRDRKFLSLNGHKRTRPYMVQCSVLLYGSTLKIMGRHSSVGIATRYGTDGPGIESRWGRDFPHPSRPSLGPTQPPVQWVPGLSRG